MLPDLFEIKEKRIQLGLTQTELAKLAGVSQALITKVEAGKIIPTYEKAKRVFDALALVYTKRNVNAKDLMQGKIIAVSPCESVKGAVKLMEKHAISQLPVLEQGKPVGLLSEKSILSRLGKGSDAIDLAELEVEKVMEEAPPVIHKGAPFQLVAELLKLRPVVLIAEKGKLKGLISKSDLMRIILKKR